MKLVLLFFCGFIISVIGLFIIIILSTIKLNIKKCNITNIKEGRKKKGIDKEIAIYLEIFLLGFIKIGKIKITEKLLEKLKIKNDVKSIRKDVNVAKSINIIEIIKKLKIKPEKIKMYLAIGTENVMLTVNLVAIISSIIAIIFRGVNPKKTEYRIIPLYNYGNSIKFNLNCIISVKIVHIIYVIYILLKKRRSKNERTSNRRSYDYSYE